MNTLTSSNYYKVAITGGRFKLLDGKQLATRRDIKVMVGSNNVP